MTYCRMEVFLSNALASFNFNKLSTEKPRCCSVSLSEFPTCSYRWLIRRNNAKETVSIYVGWFVMLCWPQQEVYCSLNAHAHSLLISVSKRNVFTNEITTHFKDDFQHFFQLCTQFDIVTSRFHPLQFHLTKMQNVMSINDHLTKCIALYVTQQHKIKRHVMSYELAPRLSAKVNCKNNNMRAHTPHIPCTHVGVQQTIVYKSCNLGKW